MDGFEEYLMQNQPNKAERTKVWKTAIDLPGSTCCVFVVLFFRFVC